MRRLTLPGAAILGLGLGALAASCGQQPRGIDSEMGTLFGERLIARVENPAPPPVYETPPADWVWTAWLPEAQPAIRACRAAVEEPETVITQAWPLRKGVTAVHLRGPAGARWECVAPAVGLSVDRLDRLPETAGPEGPVFVPRGVTAPAGCGPAVPAVDATGRAIGQILPGPC